MWTYFVRLSSVPSDPKRKLAHFSRNTDLDSDKNKILLTQSVDIDLSEDPDKDQKRLSRDVNSSVRAEKPFSEKKALIANLFKKEEVPLQKAPRVKLQVSSAMEERRKLLQGAMPDLSEASTESEVSERSQRIARMIEQQKQIQIMSADSRPVQKLELDFGRNRSHSDSTQIIQKKSPGTPYSGVKESQKCSPLVSQTTATTPIAQQQQQQPVQTPQQTAQPTQQPLSPTDVSLINK